MNREPVRSRTIDGHLSVETTPIPQRTSSRQTLLVVKMIEITTEFMILYYLESSISIGLDGSS